INECGNETGLGEDLLVIRKRQRSVFGSQADLEQDSQRIKNQPANDNDGQRHHKIALSLLPQGFERADDRRKKWVTTRQIQQVRTPSPQPSPRWGEGVDRVCRTVCPPTHSDADLRRTTERRFRSLASSLRRVSHRHRNLLGQTPSPLWGCA